MTMLGAATGRAGAARRVGAAAVAVRRVCAATPLWMRLVTAVLALVVLALGVAGAATTTALHRYLLQQVDSQLGAAGSRILAGHRDPGFGMAPPGQGDERSGSGRLRLPSAFSVGITDENGVLWTRCIPRCRPACRGPPYRPGRRNRLPPGTSIR